MALDYTVYKHTSPSGKVYIGITCGSVENRWRNGRGYNKQYLFYNAILKYGWNNIKHEILYSNLTKEEAYNLEIKLISHYKNLSISYNILDGGEFGCLGLKKNKKQLKAHSIMMKKRWLDNPEMFKNLSRKGCKNSIEMRRKKSKPVIQFSLDGDIITEYLSIPDATIATGIHGKSIIHCCNGGYYCKTRNKFVNVKQAGGFIWKYKEVLYD